MAQFKFKFTIININICNILIKHDYTSIILRSHTNNIMQNTIMHNNNNNVCIIIFIIIYIRERLPDNKFAR